MAIHTVATHLSKFKRSSLIQLGRHNDRKIKNDSNKNIDKDLQKNNFKSEPDEYKGLTLSKKVSKAIDTRYKKDKSIRKDATLVVEAVIGTDRELFKRDPQKHQEVLKAQLKVLKEFTDEAGWEYLGSTLHQDEVLLDEDTKEKIYEEDGTPEINPHLHVDFFPISKDGKSLSAKKLMTPAKLKQIQTKLQEAAREVAPEFEFDFKNLGRDRLSTKEYKEREQYKFDKQAKELEAKEQSIKKQTEKLKQQYQDIQQQLNEQEKTIQEKQKIENERIEKVKKSIKLAQLRIKKDRVRSAIVADPNVDVAQFRRWIAIGVDKNKVIIKPHSDLDELDQKHVLTLDDDEIISKLAASYTLKEFDQGNMSIKKIEEIRLDTERKVNHQKELEKARKQEQIDLYITGVSYGLSKNMDMAKAKEVGKWYSENILKLNGKSIDNEDPNNVIERTVRDVSFSTGKQLQRNGTNYKRLYKEIDNEL